MNPVKDFRVVARIYNNQLRERREALGLSSTAFAEKVGVHPSYYCGFETFRASPLRQRNGVSTWTAIARRIAEAFGVEPRVLWPDAALSVRVAKTERRLNAEEMAGLLAPSVDRSPLGLLSSGEESRAIADAICNLTPRQAEVIRMRFGFEDGHETLGDIAEHLGLSVERVRQIEATALRRLRHTSSRIAELKP